MEAALADRQMDLVVAVLHEDGGRPPIQQNNGAVFPGARIEGNVHGRDDGLGRECIGFERECIVLIVFAQASDIADGAAWSIGEGQFKFRLVGRPSSKLLQFLAYLGRAFGAGALFRGAVCAVFATLHAVILAAQLRSAWSWRMIEN